MDAQGFWLNFLLSVSIKSLTFGIKIFLCDKILKGYNEKPDTSKMIRIQYIWKLRNYNISVDVQGFWLNFLLSVPSKGLTFGIKIFLCDKILTWYNEKPDTSKIIGTKYIWILLLGNLNI